MKNWSGNVLFEPNLVVHPVSIADIQSAVTAAEKVRALGSAHSFNEIASSPDLLLAFDHFPKDIEIDSETKQVRVAAGVRYGELAIALHAAGLALPNMGSLPHITVVGATSTGTHGSGVRNQNLSAAIVKIELITASGEDVVIEGQQLAAARVGVGALGVIHHITLQAISSFDVSQVVYRDLGYENWLENFDAAMGSHYSISAFTTWGDTLVDQLWIKSKIGEPSIPSGEYLSGVRADEKLHPLQGADTQSATEQLGSVGPWHERLPHFKLDFTPSFGDELQSEYFVDIKDAKAALQSVHALREQIRPLLLVTELRTIAQDSNWLSQSYERDTLAIHFTWKPDVPGVSAFLPTLERALSEFKARPHWGKLFSSESYNFWDLYPRFEEWRNFRKSMDLERKFVNGQLAAWGI